VPLKIFHGESGGFDILEVDECDRLTGLVMAKSQFPEARLALKYIPYFVFLGVGAQ